MILVTGGAGFIGSNLTRALLDDGEQVVCLDDFNDYYNPSFKERNTRSFIKNKHFKLYKGDIRDKRILDKIFKENDIEVVAHLAARAGVRASLKDPMLYTNVNLCGTTLLLQKSIDSKVENFVLASTSSVYGDTKKIPFREDDESGRQMSPYAVSKRAAELMCRFYTLNYGLPTTCLRFFTVYGPNGRPDMVMFKFTKALMEGRQFEVYGDGNSSRDYTYISDIVAGIKTAIKKRFKFEIINLGNNKPIELNYLISILEDETGKKVSRENAGEQEGDIFATCADISKAKRLLGYNPEVSIEEGVKRFVEWYKSEVVEK